METPTVMSIDMQPLDGELLPEPLPGQYLTIRIPDASDPPPLRSYSLSGAPSAHHYRISVKRESRGLVSQWLHANLRAGAVVEAAAPRGDFYLRAGDSAIVLISAGIGATPLLAMMHMLAATSDRRPIWWLHTTRNTESHAFMAEVSSLVDSLPCAIQHIYYTGGEASQDFIVRGRLDQDAITALHLPTNAAVYLCGPDAFMTAMREALVGTGIEPGRIHTELFGALPAINPGVVGSPAIRPHPPAGSAGTGPPVTFARSGLTAEWSPDYGSILELAEACDVPTRYSCRSGVCHTCVTPVIDGTAVYRQPPLEEPAAGALLICTAVPRTDLVIDL
jgi:ferredoxin-NADP reductase